MPLHLQMIASHFLLRIFSLWQAHPWAWMSLSSGLKPTFLRYRIDRLGIFLRMPIGVCLTHSFKSNPNPPFFRQKTAASPRPVFLTHAPFLWDRRTLESVGGSIKRICILSELEVYSKRGTGDSDSSSMNYIWRVRSLLLYNSLLTSITSSITT